MSRSYKKTPIFGHTTTDTEKYDKRLANSKFRLKAKKAINNEIYDDCPVSMNEVSNVWWFGKDGKYFSNHVKSRKHKYMRK